MMIVQKVEFFEHKSCNKIRYLQSSVSPLSRIVSALFSFYVVVIYINHFKRVYHTATEIVSKSLTVIGNMTNHETRDIRNLSAYPL